MSTPNLAAVPTQTCATPDSVAQRRIGESGTPMQQLEQSTVSDFDALWEYTGFPHIELEEAHVTHKGRSWGQRRLVIADGRPGVVIVPVCGDEVGLVRLWRPCVGEMRLELPRGFGKGPTTANDAHREFVEETGLVPATVRQLGMLDLDTGLIPTPIAVFEVTAAQRDATQDTDPEVDDLVWVPRSSIPELIADGDLCDCISLSAIAVWQAQGAQPAREAAEAVAVA